MKNILIVWKLIILVLVVLFSPQIALSDTYTFANWQPLVLIIQVARLP